MHRIVPVLRHREEKSRLALAHLARELAQVRSRVRTIDLMSDSVTQRMRANLDSRYTHGARTVAALTELEADLKALRTLQEHLSGLKQQAQQALEQLATRHRLAGREWRRQDVRLGYVDSLVRRERISQEVRACELDDEVQSEARSLSGHMP